MRDARNKQESTQGCAGCKPIPPCACSVKPLRDMHACGFQEAAAKRARDQARREAVRARRDREKPKTPALQRVMDAVPEGPLGLLRRCHLARDAVRVRVVTRHRRGVRGVATGPRRCA